MFGEFLFDLLVGARRRIGEFEIAPRRDDPLEPFAIFVDRFETLHAASQFEVAVDPGAGPPRARSWFRRHSDTPRCRSYADDIEQSAFVEKIMSKQLRL